MFESPCDFEGDISGEAAEFEDGHDIGFWGISDHEKGVDVDIFAFKELSIGLSIFVVNDEVIDVVIEGGIIEFSLLFVEFAFGDNDNFIEFLE